MRTTRALTVTTALAVTLSHVPEAHAVTCDQLVLGDDDEDVVIGEAGHVSCPPFMQGCIFTSVALEPQLGVCWRDESGEWNLEVLDCTNDHVAGDTFVLSTRGGDDRVSVLRSEHTAGHLDLLNAGGGQRAMYCGPYGDALAPYRSDFAFSINVSLGTGTDLYHGSDKVDYAWSNGIVPPAATPAADHSTPDKICTYAGNDSIYGDRDNNRLIGEEDLMDAGAGVDWCDGDAFVSLGDAGDAGRSCDVLIDARDDENIGQIDCTEDDNPIDEW